MEGRRFTTSVHGREWFAELCMDRVLLFRAPCPRLSPGITSSLSSSPRRVEMKISCVSSHWQVDRIFVVHVSRTSTFWGRPFRPSQKPFVWLWCWVKNWGTVPCLSELWVCEFSAFWFCPALYSDKGVSDHPFLWEIRMLCAKLSLCVFSLTLPPPAEDSPAGLCLNPNNGLRNTMHLVQGHSW